MQLTTGKDLDPCDAVLLVLLYRAQQTIISVTDAELREASTYFKGKNMMMLVDDTDEGIAVKMLDQAELQMLAEGVTDNTKDVEDTMAPPGTLLN